MTHFRLAHFSDVHYTLNPFENLPDSLRGKRAGGLFSYFAGGRRTRFRDSGARIGALLDDIDRQKVDHALCTGDLTSVSLNAEFEGLARVFGDRIRQPARYTVIPGNHDRYVQEAVRDRSYERQFAALAAESFPFAKPIGPGVRVVAMDVARPTSLIDSSGLCGPDQRTAVSQLLAADSGSVTVVALHYGLLRWRGNPDRAHHGLRDAAEVMKLLNDSPARIALVLHGHMHAAFVVHSGKLAIVCAGSATDLLVDCGYFIHDIDLDTLAVTVERREWNRATMRYEPVDATKVNDALRERRGVTMDRRTWK